MKELEVLLGHEFKNADLLKVALTHRSHHFENKATSLGHFERMEFLGDAVLDLLLSELLMDRYLDVDEGTLSKWRASLVNERSLGEVAQKLNIGKFLFLGRSEAQAVRSDSPLRPRLLASVFEAVVAAIYQDAGLSAAKKFIEREFAPKIGQLDAENGFVEDFKTRLQEWAQKKFKTLPEYRLLEAQGPEHAKKFRYEVWLKDQCLGQGEGASRKGAEQSAAKAALKGLGEMV